MQVPAVGFTLSQAAALTGLTPKQISYFDRSGLLAPEIQGARGKGSRRLYSFRDLVALRVIALLRQGGVRPQTIRRVADDIRATLDPACSGLLVVVAGDDIGWVRGNTPLDQVIRQPGQWAVLLDVAGMVRQVEAAIRAIQAVG